MKNLPLLILTFLFSSQLIFHSAGRAERNSGPDSTSTVTLSFVGDLMCHSPQMEYAAVGKDSFNFKPVFSEVKKYLSASDLTIGNLETTISGKESRYSGYPLFNSPDEYLEALKDAGFDLLFTANNHCMDRGKKGIIRTIDKINSLGISSVGTSKSQKDRDSIRVIEINGIRLAFLAYTFGVNGNYISKNEKFLVNLIDTTLIKNDIKAVKDSKVDAVLVYFHFGEEYQRKPNSYQKEIVKCAVHSGADIIIGSHPHTLQPIEYFLSDKNNIGEGIIAYSLGNFLSNQRWRYSDAGAVLNLTITKNILTDKIKLKEASVIPTWVFKGVIKGKNEFVILPADTASAYTYLKKSDRTDLIQSYLDSKDIFKPVRGIISQDK